jgi:hypothetical protein
VTRQPLRAVDDCKAAALSSAHDRAASRRLHRRAGTPPLCNCKLKDKAHHARCSCLAPKRLINGDSNIKTVLTILSAAGRGCDPLDRRDHRLGQVHDRLHHRAAGRHDPCWFRLLWRSEMSKLGIVRATALSLALAVATPAFAVGLRNVGGAMHVGNGGFRGAQASIGSVGTSAADASYCRQRWAYYDPVARKYMGDDGEWRSCPAGSAAQVAAATKRHTRKAHRASVSAQAGSSAMLMITWSGRLPLQSSTGPTIVRAM